MAYLESAVIRLTFEDMGRFGEVLQSLGYPLVNWCILRLVEPGDIKGNYSAHLIRRTQYKPVDSLDEL